MFKLPTLPYEKNSLTPFISEETINYHYGKHHQTYLNNLNILLKNNENKNFSNKSLEQIILTSKNQLFNNAAQVWNHNFYWLCLTPNFSINEKSNLFNAIIRYFETFENFKDQFTDVALNTFGSGWVWLVKTPAGELKIMNTANADCPITSQHIPLLACDVWEHAYYLDTRNSRPDYMKNFWKIVNWHFVDQQFNLIT